MKLKVAQIWMSLVGAVVVVAFGYGIITSWEFRVIGGVATLIAITVWAFVTLIENPGPRV
jgi:hypothetical protein